MNHIYVLNPNQAGSGNSPLDKIAFTDLNTVGESVFTTAGQIYGWNISNTGNTYVYIKFFDNVAPVIGTTTPTLVISVPPGGNNSSFSYEGIYFANACYIFATTGPANNNLDDPSLHQVIGEIFYVGENSPFPSDILDIFDIFELVPPYKAP